MRDEELILRFLAFSEALPDYKKPMKEFLSKFMHRNRNASESLIDRYRTLFLTVVNAVHAQLGLKPFHIHKALNAAVYDAVFVALAHADPLPDDLSARYARLKEDQSFMACTISGTTADAVVRERIKVAKKVLLGQE
jgi:hypothetical protein